MTAIEAPDERVEVRASDLSLGERAAALVDGGLIGYGIRYEAATRIETLNFLGGAYHEIRSRNGQPFEDAPIGVRFYRLGEEILISA